MTGFVVQYQYINIKNIKNHATHAVHITCISDIF